MKIRRIWAFSTAALAALVIGSTVSADIFVSGNHNSILQFDDAGVFLGQFNVGGSIIDGRGVTFGPDGNMYVCSLSTGDVQRFDGTTGVFIDSFGPVTDPWHLVFRDNGNLLVSTFQGNVQEFDPSGAPLGTFASGAVAAGLTFGPDGNLYVGSFLQSCVRRYNGVTGAFIDIFVGPGAGGLSGADGVHFGPDGRFYVSSRNTNQVLRYNGATGAFIDVFTSGQAPNPPVDLKFGPDGHLAVISALSNQGVNRYDGATGTFSGTYAIGGGMDVPTHFTFDPSDDCPWDLDGGGFVGAGDLLQLLADWGDPYGAADLLDLLAAWGACPGAAECKGQVCPNYTFDCDPNDDTCVCYTLVDGSGFCGESIPCGDAIPCDDDGDCPPGFRCAILTCCGDQSICIPECDGIPGPDAPGDQRTSTGR